MYNVNFEYFNAYACRWMQDSFTDLTEKGAKDLKAQMENDVDFRKIEIERDDNMKTYDEMVKEAIDMIENNDDLFCSLVDELDGWNGFADGFKCWDMCYIDEFFGDMKLMDFLATIASDFNIRDDYFCDTIWGISSTDDKAGFYRDNTTAEDIFDAVLNNYNHLYIDDSNFSDLMKEIVNFSEENDTEAL